MAELYFKQGHVQQACEVCRRLVACNPHDTAAAERLALFEAQLRQQRRGKMSFREQLQKIVESTPGALGCSIMGFDGIAIDSFELQGVGIDLSTLLIEYSAITQQLRRSAELTGIVGGIQELTVTADAVTAIIRPLTNEYFLAVVVSSQGLSGKARYVARIAAPSLAKELS